MHVEQALAHLKNFEPIVIMGKTFEPQTIDEVKLESGERVFWVHGSDGAWLSIDPDSEEILNFMTIEEELSGGRDLKLYAGEEYEFSYEGSAKVVDEEGEQETVSFRDYESSGNAILRIIQHEISGEKTVSVGQILTEEVLQSF